MTDEELPDNEDEQDGDETPDIPPPSTFAGKARQEPSAGTGSDAAEADEPAEDKVPVPTVDAVSPAEEVEEADDAEPPVDDTIVVPPPQVSGETIEADTLTLSDVEAQREAAHAGLAKRAEKSSFSHQVTTGSHKVQPPAAAPPVAAAAAAEEGDEGVGKPPKRRIGWRFTAAAFVIVSSMAAATAVSFLLFLNDIAKGLNDSSLSAARQQLETVEGGAPQTILILGSDKRETTVGDPGRSDTAILLRVDPDKDSGFLSLMSLPRDLEVPIPGYGTTKINAAYSYGQQEDPTGGGETLAIKTITNYLDIPINHVVNVDFGGFLEAVNAIGCVYIDVDRHYFNPVGGEYAEIDVEAGYQKLCGYKALQYVRYRHTDNDLVRGARQQDFIREARQRIPPGELLPFFGNGEEYIDIFTENTSSDIDSASAIVGMLKTFASVRNAPVRQVDFGKLSPDGGVVASPAEVDAAVEQFLGSDLDEAPPEQAAEPSSGGGNEGGGGGDDKEKPKPEPPTQAPLVDFAGPAQAKAAEFAKTLQHRKLEFPIFYPTRLVQSANTAISEESRAAALLGPNSEDIYGMYKFVIPFQPLYGDYYGFSGTNWDDPPILKNPSDTRTINGREFLLFYEQDKLRLVGWRTSKGSYWVINTLSHALTEAQMLELAASTRELGG